VAAVRSRIRLATRCAPVGYRNLAHLAKIAAGVDVISREQLTLGNDGADEQHLAQSIFVADIASEIRPRFIGTGKDNWSAGTRLVMLDVQIGSRGQTSALAATAGKLALVSRFRQ
jgi:hypothetical protein